MVRRTLEGFLAIPLRTDLGALCLSRPQGSENNEEAHILYEPDSLYSQPGCQRQLDSEIETIHLILARLQSKESLVDAHEKRPARRLTDLLFTQQLDKAAATLPIFFCLLERANKILQRMAKTPTGVAIVDSAMLSLTWFGSTFRVDFSLQLWQVHYPGFRKEYITTILIPAASNRLLAACGGSDVAPSPANVSPSESLSAPRAAPHPTRTSPPPSASGGVSTGGVHWGSTGGVPTGGVPTGGIPVRSQASHSSTTSAANNSNKSAQLELTDRMPTSRSPHSEGGVEAVVTPEKAESLLDMPNVKLAESLLDEQAVIASSSAPSSPLKLAELGTSSAALSSDKRIGNPSNDTGLQTMSLSTGSPCPGVLDATPSRALTAAAVAPGTAPLAEAPSHPPRGTVSSSATNTSRAPVAAVTRSSGKRPASAAFPPAAASALADKLAADCDVLLRQESPGLHHKGLGVYVNPCAQPPVSRGAISTVSLQGGAVIGIVTGRRSYQSGVAHFDSAEQGYAASFHKQPVSSGRLLISGHPSSDAWSLLNGSQTPNCELVGFEICVSDSDIRRDSSSNLSETEYTFEIMAVAVKQGVTVKPNDVLTLDYGSEYTVGAHGLPVSGRQPGAYDVQVEALSSINSLRLLGFSAHLTAAAVLLYGCAVSSDGAALQKDVLTRAGDRNSGRRDYSAIGLRSCCLSTRLHPFLDASAGDLPPGWRFSIAVAVSALQALEQGFRQALPAIAMESGVEDILALWHHNADQTRRAPHVDSAIEPLRLLTLELLVHYDTTEGTFTEAVTRAASVSELTRLIVCLVPRGERLPVFNEGGRSGSLGTRPGLRPSHLGTARIQATRYLRGVQPSALHDR